MSSWLLGQLIVIGIAVLGTAIALLFHERPSRSAKELREESMRKIGHQMVATGFRRGKIFYGFDGPEVLIGFRENGTTASCVLVDRISRPVRRSIEDHQLEKFLPASASRFARFRSLPTIRGGGDQTDPVS